MVQIVPYLVLEWRVGGGLPQDEGSGFSRIIYLLVNSRNLTSSVSYAFCYGLHATRIEAPSEKEKNGRKGSVKHAASCIFSLTRHFYVLFFFVLQSRSAQCRLTTTSQTIASFAKLSSKFIRAQVFVCFLTSFYRGNIPSMKLVETDKT